MRLTHIKLAGFKSFVDPTSIPVPGQLVAVCGPNGCGKSNVIDAVRWVLGESSAKQLRGESMQDVIFNGSGTRKPGSRASVELVFDNGEGRASGTWGQYTEIAIKRVLTRQGESSYWINGQQVRRRDIADLFLGTGVGTKGYAVIEQGMISRIIEARPEELRAYLEEAAGVSKYKERRKETESRLADTRDNLARLHDIREELTRQVEKLAEQAEVAQRYQGMRDELAELQNLLALTRKRDAQEAEAKASAELARLETELAMLSSRGTELDAAIEAAREAHFAAGDEVSTRQQHLADLSAQVARLEEQARHHQDTRARVEREFASARTEQSALASQAHQIETELAEWTERRDEARYAAEEAQMALDGGDGSLPDAEQQFRSRDSQLAALTNKVAELTRGRDLAEQRAAAGQRTLAQLQERRGRLRDEHAELALPAAGELADAADAARQSASALDTARQAVDHEENRLAELDRERQAVDRERASQRDALSALDAEAGALTKLLDAAQARAGMGDWLARQQLADAPQLLDALRIDAGWETALEAALAHTATARLSATLPSDTPPAPLVLAREAAAPALPPSALTPLLRHITLDDARFAPLLGDTLALCFAADSLDAALALRDSLPPGGRCYTVDGHAVSRHGIHYHAQRGETSIVARRAERDALLAQRDRQQPQLLALEARLTTLDSERAATRDAIAAARDAQAAAQQADTDARMTLSAIEQKKHQGEARAQAIADELQRLDDDDASERLQIEEAQLSAEEAQLSLDEVAAALEQARVARLDAETGLALARDKARELERQGQETRFALASSQQRVSELERRRGELNERLDILAEKLEALAIERETFDDDDLADRLHEALYAREQAQDAVTAARETSQAAEQRLRELTRARHDADSGLAPVRDAISQMLLKAQEAKLAFERYDEELREARADEDALVARLSEGRKAATLTADIGKLAQALNALGAVNLAALDELSGARERETYLLAQHEDLVAAMATLEQAITRIDGETREQLRSTFEAVNASMMELFPLLFGGGQARLVLTGEDLLDAGIQIIAQPPGKKNSTIHLLSGGEKALTAMSLVFSLFQLNPAPFCLLDEVDAPLDDANTGRFCELVKKMADKTQFLYISHNRLTMEMAEQLVGVTMQEQGVSRIVAVDIVEALRMREAM